MISYCQHTNYNHPPSTPKGAQFSLRRGLRQWGLWGWLGPPNSRGGAEVQVLLLLLHIQVLAASSL